MKKKIFYFLFVLCLIKLYHISDQSLHFSSKLLANSFSKNTGEKESLGYLSKDLIQIREFFHESNISDYELSREISDTDLYHQRIIEFTYPIKLKNKSTTLIATKTEEVSTNCNLINYTDTFKIYECKK